MKISGSNSSVTPKAFKASKDDIVFSLEASIAKSDYSMGIGQRYGDESLSSSYQITLGLEKQQPQQQQQQQQQQLLEQRQQPQDEYSSRRSTGQSEDIPSLDYCNEVDSADSSSLAAYAPVMVDVTPLKTSNTLKPGDIRSSIFPCGCDGGHKCLHQGHIRGMMCTGMISMAQVTKGVVNCHDCSTKLRKMKTGHPLTVEQLEIKAAKAAKTAAVEEKASLSQCACNGGANCLRDDHMYGTPCESVLSVEHEKSGNAHVCFACSQKRIVGVVEPMPCQCAGDEACRHYYPHVTSTCKGLIAVSQVRMGKKRCSACVKRNRGGPRSGLPRQNPGYQVTQITRATGTTTTTRCLPKRSSLPAPAPVLSPQPSPPLFPSLSAHKFMFSTPSLSSLPNTLASYTSPSSPAPSFSSFVSEPKRVGPFMQTSTCFPSALPVCAVGPPVIIDVSNPLQLALFQLDQNVYMC